MILVVDIGNSSITSAIFDDDKLVRKFYAETNKNSKSGDFKKYLENTFKTEKFDRCVICSVVDEITHEFEPACREAFGIKPIIVNADLNLGIGFETDKPLSIGADRLANVFGALKYTLPVIVVDIGTAVTFDILDQNKTFIGGVIMPGINMQLNSLESGTSKLPKIEAEKSDFAIGKDTKTCILSGVIRGTACAIDGLIKQCENELGEKATIIITGGQGDLISEHMTRKPDFVDKDFTLKSLNDISKII